MLPHRDNDRTEEPDATTKTGPHSYTDAISMIQKEVETEANESDSEEFSDPRKVTGRVLRKLDVDMDTELDTAVLSEVYHTLVEMESIHTEWEYKTNVEEVYWWINDYQKKHNVMAVENFSFLMEGEEAVVKARTASLFKFCRTLMDRVMIVNRLLRHISEGKDVYVLALPEESKFLFLCSKATIL